MSVYDYCQLKKDIDVIKKNFPFIDVDVIGKSVNGRNIYSLRLGKGEKKILYNAAHHGLEWITAKLLMKFVFDYAKSYIKGVRLKGYNIRKLHERVSIYIVPMVNPDGIEISKEMKMWQSNARGVDLNHNYDAGWEEYKELAEKEGIGVPSHTRFPGAHPESEPESKALADFTRRINPEYVLAFHSQGQVIYWQYQDYFPPNSLEIAQKLSAVSGYKLDLADGLSSYSGYKDWFIKEFGKPGYTIEVGAGENPLPIEQFDGIYSDILEMLVMAETL
ncbi:MAG: M14 family metallocarboxypeptidase [Eubacteriales bacterium]|jgi:g-D-glutamyl-meso-diaminopimelate peptidase|nr:M14 family metallocarboxypeptidase [Eubacteriales bacterium]